ncbi:HD-GYP domain-containing protein [Paenibacillus sp. PvR148]
MSHLLGKRLKKNIYSRYGILILPASSILTTESIQSIHQHGLKLRSNDVVSPEFEPEQLVGFAVNEMKELFADIRTAGRVPVDKVYSTVLPAINKLVKSSDTHRILLALETQDDDTFKHSVGVSVMAGLIGKWLGLSVQERVRISMAGLFHDVGKLFVPLSILHKPGKLDDNEFREIKRHSQYGYELLRRESGLDPLIALAALQHHEREDGSGYPAGLSGNRLEQVSKIVAVADVFHAMSSKRAYRNALPLFDVLQSIADHAYGLLEPGIVRCFIRHMTECMIGSRVSLSDGTQATVVMVHVGDPFRPLVYGSGQFIDLRQRPELKIGSLSSGTPVPV